MRYPQGALLRVSLFKHSIFLAVGVVSQFSAFSLFSLYMKGKWAGKMIMQALTPTTASRQEEQEEHLFSVSLPSCKPWLIESLSCI